MARPRLLRAAIIGPTSALAGNLVAKGGVCGLDLACFRQHLLDLAVRDHYGAGRVGEHVRPGYHAYTIEHHRHVCLKRRDTVASPMRRLARAVGGEVVARELVEVAQAAV